jgi:hypothetical protein
MLRSTTSRAVLLALLFLAGTALSAAELRDVVYLKNGSVVRGIIVEQIPNKTIKIQRGSRKRRKSPKPSPVPKHELPDTDHTRSQSSLV